LVEKGVEVVHGDLNDVDSVTKAVQGANVVFGNTNFWSTVFNPASYQKLAPGQEIGTYAYDIEVQLGKNIADAVATIADTTLDLYVWSSLKGAKKLSNGKYLRLYHFDSKDHVYDYIKSEYPHLAKKTSAYLSGQYAENWLGPLRIVPQKGEDGVYEQRINVKPETLLQWINASGDTGKIVRALVRAGPGKDVLGVSESLSYGDFLKIWGEVNGVPTRYKVISNEEFRTLMPEPVSHEFQEMFSWIDEIGYYGNQPDALSPSEVSMYRFSLKYGI
jgi:hypothetical protein